MKKAQGISMNVIIIAAIALLVLVVLTVIFLGRIGEFGKGSKDCIAQGGVCAIECGSGDAEGYDQPYPSWTCYDEEGKPDTVRRCCISTGV